MNKVIKMTGLYFLGLFLIGVSLPAAAFSTRVPVTISNPTGAALVNHTVRLELNATTVPGFDWSNNGNDIFVSDSGTMLNAIDYYLESFDGVAQQAVLWVEVPNVPASPPDTTIYLHYGDPTASSLSNAPNTFTTNGFKYHTQFYDDAAPGPESRADGEAVFDFDTVAAAGSGYGCTALGSIEVDNSGTFGSNFDVALFYETIFEVPTAATYEFRMGADFGDGGELYVDGTTVEADWSDDLWWALSYTSPDTLTGSIFLSAGFHSLKALGFERCCDGPSGIQFRTSPTGPWVDFEVGTSGLDLYAPSCPVTSTMFGSPETVPVTLNKFSSDKAGPYLKIKWQTADETFNVGFNLWAEVDGEWQQINRRMVRSHRIDSLNKQKYSHKVNLNKLKIQPDMVALSSIDVVGKQEFHGPFEIGESYGQEYVNQPIDWESVQQQYVLRMQALGYHYVNNRWRKLKKNKPTVTHSTVVIEVEQEGIHRITYEDLLALGVDWAGISKRDIAVTYQQSAIPRRVGGGGKFGVGSYIDFVGLTPRGDDNLYHSTTLFQLSVNRQFARHAPSLKRQPNNVANWHMKSLVLNEKRAYVVQSPSQDPWQMDVLVASTAPKAKTYQFDIEETPLNNKKASLNLLVNGISDLPEQDLDSDGHPDDDHHVHIYLNGNSKPVYEAWFDGNTTYPIEFEFPAKLLTKGTNYVAVELAADTGYVFDFVSIESIKLNVPVLSVSTAFSKMHAVNRDMVSNGLVFSAANKRDIVAYAYQDNFNLLRLVANKHGKHLWSVPKTSVADTHYWVSSVNQLLSPKTMWVLPYDVEQIKRDPLITESHELLIISHPVFITDELDAYSRERAKQGVTNIIINTEDILKKYGIGLSLTNAIQRFLQDIDKTIEYQSVLLVGGHSYDYKNHQQKASESFIPTFYRSVGLARFSPTDVPFIDFNDDGIPEKAIGRWPVRSQENLTAIIDKSLSWVDNKSARIQNGLNVLLLADRTAKLDFASALETQEQQLKATDFNIQAVQKIYIDSIIQNTTLPDDQVYQSVREQVSQAMSEVDWLIYNGHGSPSTWSPRGLLNTDSIAQMHNTGHPVLITSLGCYTTYYESPTHNSLAHQLLFSADRAAVAVHGPMMLGEYFSQLNLADLIAKLSATGKSIGTVIKQAKQQLPASAKNISYNWALLGDPTLQIQ